MTAISLPSVQATTTSVSHCNMLLQQQFKLPVLVLLHVPTAAAAKLVNNSVYVLPSM
jgi:hypothetical protein